MFNWIHFTTGMDLIKNNFINFSFNHKILILVTIILSIDVLLAGTVLALYTATQLASRSSTVNSIVDIHINMITLLLSLVCLIIATYLMANSLTYVASW